MKTLQEYLAGHFPHTLDFSIRVADVVGGKPHFYIHPEGKNGETLDFVVDGDRVTLLDLSLPSPT